MIRERDHIEETKRPVAGIACKAPTSEGINPDRCPSFPLPKAVGVCSRVLQRCTVQHFGLHFRKSLGYTLNFKDMLNSFP